MSSLSQSSSSVSSISSPPGDLSLSSSYTKKNKPRCDLELFEAVHFGHVELIQRLIDSGAKPCQEFCNNAPSKKIDVFTAATMRAARASDFDLEQLKQRCLVVLREGFRDFTILPKGLIGIIEDYAVFGRLDSLRWLYICKLKPMVDVTSAIFDALDAGDFEAMEIMFQYEGSSLLQKKSPENHIGSPTLLNHALRVIRYAPKEERWRDDFKCVQLLLEHKADVKEPGLLDTCVYNFKHDIVRALLDAGASNFQEQEMNPLWPIVSNHSFSEQQKIDAVQLLVDYGLLKKSHHNFEGLGQSPMCMPRYVPPTAVEYATEEKQMKLAKLLQSLL